MWRAATHQTQSEQPTPTAPGWREVEERQRLKENDQKQRVVSKEGRSGCEGPRDGRGWYLGVGLVRARDWDDGQGPWRAPRPGSGASVGVRTPRRTPRCAGDRRNQYGASATTACVGKRSSGTWAGTAGQPAESPSTGRPFKPPCAGSHGAGGAHRGRRARWPQPVGGCLCTPTRAARVGGGLSDRLWEPEVHDVAKAVWPRLPG